MQSIKSQRNSSTSKLLFDIDDYSIYPKFREIKETFEKLFRSKGYSSESKFEKDVWFMESDREFQNLIRPTSKITPDDNTNRMLTLLREMSDADDLKKMSVDTGKFIHQICEILMRAHQMVVRSNEQIKEYRAHENVNVLEVKYSMLNQKYSEKKDSISNLKIKIGRLDLLPKGQYNFKLKLKEMNPRDLKVMKNTSKNLINNNLVNIKHSGDVILLNTSENQNFFETIEFSSLDITEDKKYQDRFDYSGTTLSSFSLQIFKNDELFAESSSENFLDMLLVLIPNLRDIEKSNFQVAWRMTAKHATEDKHDIFTEFDTFFEFQFELDALTRSSIIGRILNILKEAIRTETQNEIIKNEILDFYFQPISDKIKYILAKPDEDFEEEGCKCNINGCLIF